MTFPDLIICAADDVANFDSHSVTHIIAIRNPGSPFVCPDWFKGPFIKLNFGDVVSEKDAQACKTLPPTLEQIRDAVSFTATAFSSPSSKLLIFCDYGASRSPALAYVILAAYAGPGREAECLERIVSIRPEAVPNALVVRIGDAFLQRDGALLSPYQNYVKAFFNDPNWCP